MIVCMKQIEEILNEQKYPIPCTGPLIIFLYSEYSYIEYSYIGVLLYFPFRSLLRPPPSLPLPSSSYRRDGWLASTECEAFHSLIMSRAPFIFVSSAHVRFSQSFHLTRFIHWPFWYFLPITSSTFQSSFWFSSLHSPSCSWDSAVAHGSSGGTVEPWPSRTKNLSRLPSVHPVRGIPSSSSTLYAPSFSASSAIWYDPLHLASSLALCVCSIRVSCIRTRSPGCSSSTRSLAVSSKYRLLASLDSRRRPTALPTSSCRRSSCRARAARREKVSSISCQ